MSDVTYLFDEGSSDLVAMDEIKRAEFLGFVEELGNIEASAASVSLTMGMVGDALANDPRLEVDIQLAQGRYKAWIIRRMNYLAEHGSEKAIVGGKNKDEILGVDRIPNDTAMKLLAQMRFGDDLAIVTRQRITAELQPGAKDEVKADFSKLDRQERRELERLFKKAQNLVEKEDKTDGQ